MFDGEFKSRRNVSLGGASKKLKEQKASLIQRNQAERQKREDLRKKTNGAIVIQSFLRGSWVRQIQRDQFRQEYDKKVTELQRSNTQLVDSKNVTDLLRWLIFFYNKGKDGERLVWICQLLLKQYATSKNQVEEEFFHTWVHQIRRLLLICCRHLESCTDVSFRIAIPMRMLEVFTSPQPYCRAAPENSAKHSLQVTTFIVRNGYFRYLRGLINHRVPSSLEPSATPPTPLAASIVDLVMRPVNITCDESSQNMLPQQELGQARHEVLCGLARDVFSQELTEQMKSFLLPVLSSPNKKFPLGLLLDSLLSRNQSQHSKLSIPSSPWLLYCLLVFAQGQLETLHHSVFTYVQVLQLLIADIPKPVTVSTFQRSRNADDSDSDSDMDIGEEIHEAVLSPSLRELRDNCLYLLNSRPNVKTILTLFSRTTQSNMSRELTLEATRVLCLISYKLVTEHKLLIHKTRLLYSLAFNTTFLKQLWELVTSPSPSSEHGASIPQELLSESRVLLSEDDVEHTVLVPALWIFCCLFNHSLFSLYDYEFFRDPSVTASVSSMPFSTEELVPMTRVLQDVIVTIIDIIYPENKSNVGTEYMSAMKSVGALSALITKEPLLYTQNKWIFFLKVVTALIRQLHARDARRSFCPEDHWLSQKASIDAEQMRIDGFFEEEGATDGILRPGMSSQTARQMAILRHVPFAVPFTDRVLIFHRILQLDRRNEQGENHHFLLEDVNEVTIHRAYLYQDAFDKFAEERIPNLKKKVRVRLMNVQGLEEAGVDGGGVFREFLNELLKVGFDPNFGFFKETTEKLLYPNPQAYLAVPNYRQHFQFLGKMLGKALYENMLVELPFASFFLCKLLGKHNTNVDIHHLESMDPEMYKNLLFLKTYKGNIEDLALNFTVVNNEFGEAQVIELKPGGKDIPVKENNRIEYIHLMADYRLNKQIHIQCTEFRAGLSSVVNLEWLQMFDHNELQMLISGAQVAVDIDDLMENCHYSGGYSAQHPYIHTFWEVVVGFTDTQKRQLLKFVTSCSRPPLLGFKELYPPFCIHHGGFEDRLPSSSTCMNLLKLPEFSDVETLRSRLLYAIESGAGFELS